jgi:hypothetical protein
MGKIFNPLTLVAVVIITFVLCGGFFYVGSSYNQYQSKLDENNYNFSLGRTAGEKIGRETGFQEGYSAGINDAKANKSVFTTHDPTYKEMKDFLAADKSDQSKYIENSHTCTDYTTEVNNNAEAAGIRCASVYIIYGLTGHSIVAFNTKDRGLVFVEPQFDKEVKLTIGKSYARENGFVKPDDLDDTIIRYLIMW